jgi:probable aminopeptidase NPEPL1
VATIGFASSLKTLIKAAKTVMVVAPAAVHGKHKLPPLLGKKNDELLAELARELKPGDLGSVGTTLTGREPRTLAVAVLPDLLSRYNAPSRAECVRRVVGQVARGKGKLGIILVLDDPEHLLPQEPAQRGSSRADLRHRSRRPADQAAGSGRQHHRGGAR